MSDDRSALGELISSLRQQRDELALKMHLGQAEAKQAWEKLTAKLDKLNSDYQPLKDAVTESAGGVFQSLKQVAYEVRDGFVRIRKTL